MITREVNEKNCLYISQIMHAHISSHLAKHLIYPISKHIQKDFIKACHHHDDGWKKPDQRILINKHNMLPYTFLTIPSKLHLYIWKKTLNYNKNLSVLSQYLICYHLRYLAKTFEQKKQKNKKIQKDISDFIYSCTKQLALLKRKFLQNHLQIKLQKYHKLLQFCDELSLRICMGSTQEVSHKILNQNINLKNKNKNLYTLNPYPFKESLTIHIQAKHFKNHQKKLVTIHISPL